MISGAELQAVRAVIAIGVEDAHLVDRRGIAKGLHGAGRRAGADGGAGRRHGQITVERQWRERDAGRNDAELLQLRELAPQRGRRGVPLERVRDHRIGDFAIEQPGPEADRRARIGLVIEREPRGDIVGVATPASFGGERVIVPAQAKRRGELCAQLPFILDVKRAQSLPSAKALRAQLDRIIDDTRVEREHIGRAQRRAPAPQRGDLRRRHLDRVIAVDIPATQQGEIGMDQVGADRHPVIAETPLQFLARLPGLFQIVEHKAGMADHAHRQPGLVADRNLGAGAVLRAAIIPAEAAELQCAFIGPHIARIGGRCRDERRLAILVRSRRGESDIAAAERPAGAIDRHIAEIGAQGDGPVVAQPVVDADRAEIELIGARNIADRAKDRRIDDIGVDVARIFEIGEEERLVLDQRAADRPAALIALEALADRIAGEITARKGR